MWLHHRNCGHFKIPEVKLVDSKRFLSYKIKKLSDSTTSKSMMELLDAGILNNAFIERVTCEIHEENLLTI